jgi:hypothetical protein
LFLTKGYSEIKFDDVTILVSILVHTYMFVVLKYMFAIYVVGVVLDEKLGGLVCVQHGVEERKGEPFCE